MKKNSKGNLQSRWSSDNSNTETKSLLSFFEVLIGQNDSVCMRTEHSDKMRMRTVTMLATLSSPLSADSEKDSDKVLFSMVRLGEVREGGMTPYFVLKITSPGMLTQYTLRKNCPSFSLWKKARGIFQLIDERNKIAQV